jgi:MATE family multidrug resistance protein
MRLKKHLLETVGLAWPLIVSQVGHIVTGMVDTIFLGRLGEQSNTAQAAGILANQLFVVLLVFGIGVSYTLTPKIAGADVDSNENRKAVLLKNSTAVNLLVAVTLFVILFSATPLLDHLGQQSDVVGMAKPFFQVLTLSILPLSLFFVGKQYCEGVNNTKVAMYISIIGNVLNIIFNYILIFGKFGCPPLGYMGSCWATFIARCLMGFGFIAILYYSKRFNKVGKLALQVKLNIKDSRDLLFSGIASGFQFSFEIAAFLFAALMVGNFGKEQLVAHGIAMHLTSFTYMFGSGIGGAAMIRVGKFHAKRDFVNLGLANQASFILVCSVMGCMAIAFFIFNVILSTFFSSDIHIVEMASSLLLIAGLFQLFDGVQVTAISILRGLEDYKIPTVITLIAYWAVAMPFAYLFGFLFRLKALGIWMGLCLSLILIAVGLYWRIQILCKRMALKNIIV